MQCSQHVLGTLIPRRSSIKMWRPLLNTSMVQLTALLFSFRCDQPPSDLIPYRPLWARAVMSSEACVLLVRFSGHPQRPDGSC